MDISFCKASYTRFFDLPNRVNDRILLVISLALLLFGNSTVWAGEKLHFSTVLGFGELPLNVVETGNPDGPEILFIHGAGNAYLAFRTQFESALSKKFRIVAYDLRGHGNSGKPWQTELVTPSKVWADDMAAVIKAKQLKRPVIVGWSYGGFIVMDYVRHYGTENIAGINLVASLGGLLPVAQALPNMSGPGWQALIANGKKARSNDLQQNINASYFSAHANSKASLSAQDKQAQFAMSLSMPAYFRQVLMGRTLDNTDLVQKLTSPVLITHGKKDIIVAKSGAQRLAQILPSASLSIYQNSNHLPFFDETERFNQELSDFVDSQQ